MKKPFNPAIPNYTPKGAKKEEEEHTLDLKPCCAPSCRKPREPVKGGYYGHWGDGGACCKDCDKEMRDLPRNYGEPS